MSDANYVAALKASNPELFVDVSDYCDDPAEAAVEAEIERQMGRAPLGCTAVLHVDSKRLRPQNGGYDLYVATISGTEGYSDNEVIYFVESRCAWCDGYVDRRYKTDGTEYAVIRYYN